MVARKGFLCFLAVLQGSLLFCGGQQIDEVLIEPQVTVRVTSGVVVGARKSVTIENEFSGEGDIFLGIPYARPPIGELRFKRPLPPEPWTEARTATRWGFRCPQPPLIPFPPAVPLSEDCLTLNVFSPNVSAPNRYPVMLFIHGGSFIAGSSADFPEAGILSNFVSRQVVVVSVNYRLGVLGFFTTQTEEFPANLGMLDQIEAIKWTKENIGNFGGDPERLTVFGESAGACSVSLLTYSPLSKDLFNRGICQSGQAYTPDCVDGSDFFRQSSKLFAVNQCGLTAGEWQLEDFTKLDSCLQHMTWQEIIASKASSLTWSPVVDGSGSGAFLPDFPRNLADSRNANLTMILGTNKDEHEFFRPFLREIENFCTKLTRRLGILDVKLYKTIKLRDISRAYYDKRLGELLIMGNETGRSAITMMIRKMLDEIYRKDVYPPIEIGDFARWLQLIVQMESDKIWFASTRREANVLRRRTANSTVYLYSFNYVSQEPRSIGLYEPVTHAAELQYLFMHAPAYAFTPATGAQDFDVMAQFGEYWTNFAKYGNPTPSDGKWRPIGEERPAQYLEINSQSGMRPAYYDRAHYLWNFVIPRIRSSQSAQLFDADDGVATTTSSMVSSKPLAPLYCISLALVCAQCCAREIPSLGNFRGNY